MKKLILTLTFAITLSANAQPYFFLQDTAGYTPLSNGTSINSGTVWSGFQTFSVPIGFNFDFMDASFTSVDFEATGRLIFDVNHFYFADMIVAQGLQDKGTSSSLSPLSYELTGTAGNQILKIQVSNAEYSGDAGSSIDFQIWLYEYTSRLELHMGPVTINNPGAAFGGGPFSGLYHVTNWTPLTYGYGFMTHGDPLNPDDSTFSGQGISTNGITLNNAPNEGQVYIYTNDTSFLSVDSYTMDIIAYPNPSKDKLRISGLSGKESIQLYNSLGQLVLEAKSAHGFLELNIESLESGIYILNITDQETLVFKQQIIIE